MLALLGRLPAAVFVVAGLIALAWIMQTTGLTVATVGAFLGTKVLLLIELAIVLLPYAAAFAGLLAVVYLAIHHLEHAIAAGISSGSLLAIDFAWHMGLGVWVTAQLTGHA
jgi:hypothetical protein